MSDQHNKLALSLQTKVEVLKAVDNAPSYKKMKDVATDFNIPENASSTILKKRDTKIQVYEQQNRFRLAQSPDVEDVLLLWFKNARDLNGTCRFQVTMYTF
ncbi:UNVERIFIED_CONTAM: hypothetical protein FKN15_007018 [Acipenser sinensis]